MRKVIPELVRTRYWRGGWDVWLMRSLTVPEIGPWQGTMAIVRLPAWKVPETSISEFFVSFYEAIA